MRVLIFGVGGVGGYLASQIHSYDFDITYIARGKRFEFLKKEGLIVKSNSGDKEIKNIKVLKSIPPKGKFDIIISTVKLYDFDNFIKDLKSLDYKDSVILHLIVDKYIVDGEEYLEFPENVSYKEFVVEVSFITVQNSIVKTLNKIFKDCNIEVKKIISHQYSSSFAEKSDISPCIAGKRVIDGINTSEVMMHNLYNKKQGLFEKMFNFFS